ncbi:hypothetical protein M0R19_02095 [Candidatus Pacearchaeota archaeon]|nr:hypothetical protein [Candidatus Pacearchaeota archaeon]
MRSKNNLSKAIIFDSGTIINFAVNGLLEELKGLKKIFNGKFLITKEVYFEIVEKPMQIKRFKLEALKIKQLFSEGILEMSSSAGIDDSEISKRTKEITNLANNTFFGQGNAIHIVDLAESSCLALSMFLSKKEIKNMIAVDERTIRVLGEKPENLSNLLQKRLHTTIDSKDENFKSFEGFKFMRSTELVYVAYKRGIVTLKNHDVLDALLYAMKLNGCSISDEEIDEIKKI